MAESSETSLRDAKILDGDGALANEAANKYLMKAHAEAVKILEPECRVYGTGNRKNVCLQFQCTKCMTKRSDLRTTTVKSHQTCRSRTSSDRTVAQAAEECAVELLQKHQTCLPVRDWLTQAGDAKALTRQEAMEAALEREREREAELRLLQAGAIELSPTNEKDFDGSDLPNHPCFGRPRKRKLEEPHSDKPEPTVFDKLNADRGSADGIESGRGRKHAAKTHKTFGWLTMVVPYLLFWAFGSTKRCVDIAHACMNPMHICWTGCPCHRLVHIIVDIIFYFGVEESVNEEIRHRRRDKPGRDRDHDTAMYIVNRLVAIIGMLSSCATAMAMSALFTIYVAIAPEKGYKARVAELLRMRLCGELYDPEKEGAAVDVLDAIAVHDIRVCDVIR